MEDQNHIPEEHSTTSQRTTTKPKGSRPKDVEMLIAWICVLAFAVIMALAQFGVIGHWLGTDNATQVFSWFAPETYVQIIWVPIFVGLALWLIRIGHSRSKAKKLGSTPFTVTGALFILACVAGILWIIFWMARNYPAAISLILIQTVLVAILWIISHRKSAQLLDWIAFSLWGAWLAVECCIDIARAATYYISKDGPLSVTGQSIATIIVAALLLLIAIALRFWKQDWVYGLVTLWAVVGIGMRLMDVSKLTAGIIIVLATVSAIIMYIPWRKFTKRLDNLDSKAHTPKQVKTPTTPQPHTIDSTAVKPSDHTEVITASTHAHDAHDDSSAQ